jgi:SPP1 gp7 family putative phage head morphogenesis protein
MPDKINPAMVNHYAGQLWEAVTKGYGTDLVSADFDTPDYEMLRRLQVDVFHFSAAKNYQQLKALSGALVNEEGKLRNFAEFKEQAFKINSEHVNRWLKAEYELAVVSGQMASKWAPIQADKELFPLLRFDAVNDDRTSSICRELDGVIRPVDDSFWQVYYPPNHWGCRSDVAQESSGRITPLEQVHTPENMPAMFKTNLAANGLAFPKTHPYYTGMPQVVTEQAEALVPGFRKATTIKEAEAFALEHGLAQKVSYKGLAHVQVANDVNEVLFALKKDGVTYDEVITKTATKRGMPTYMLSNISTVLRGGELKSSALAINRAYFNNFATYEQVEDRIKVLRQKQWITAEKVQHLVWHEVGHRITTRALYAKPVVARFAKVVNDFERLGKYATTNIHETVAEIYSYYKKTGEVPDEWKEIFNTWSEIKIP